MVVHCYVRVNTSCLSTSQKEIHLSRPRGERVSLTRPPRSTCIRTDSPPCAFVPRLQARQRECVTLVSLGCVTALFVNHVSTSYSGTIPMMVTFIPLAVHLLLVRDIYVKWEDRCVCLRHYRTDGSILGEWGKKNISSQKCWSSRAHELDNQPQRLFPAGCPNSGGFYAASVPL